MEHDDLTALLKQAESLRKQRKYDESLEHCNRAIAKFPDSFDAYMQRAFVHERLRDYERAVCDGNVLVERSPGDPGPLFFRGGWLLEAGHARRAVEDLDDVVALESKSARKYHTEVARLLRALALFQLGEFHQAREDCLKVRDDTRWWALGKLQSKESVLSQIPKSDRCF